MKLRRIKICEVFMVAKETIKGILRNNPLTRKPFIEWEKKRTEEYFKEKNRILHECGYRLIDEVQSALVDIDEIFFFDFGTLLGIVREGRIISHDMDMDVGVHIKDQNTIGRIRKALISAGCKHESVNYIDGELIGQDTFVKYGIEFDIYYYRDNGDISEVLTLFRDPQKEYKGDLWDVVSLKSKPVLNTILYEFQGIQVNVPEFYEEHLVNRYGPNWRIPDKNYIYWNSFSSTITNKKGCMKKIK